MKAYNNSIEAIRDFIEYLDSRGDYDAANLEKRQILAKVEDNELISAQMIRMFKRGKIKSFDARRAEKFCHVMGIKIIILNENVPTDFTHSPKK